MRVEDILARLRLEADEKNLAGMQRFAISTGSALGVRVPALRALGKEIGRDHELALELWEKGLRETRILATLAADHRLFTEAIAEQWVADFNDWETCDQTCFNLLHKCDFAFRKCFEWSRREEEFVRRAAFALMAKLALSNKKLTDEDFVSFFPEIAGASKDPRNFVKKAVNWCLRQIGKRNLTLNASARKLADELLVLDDRTATWIARDALRELASEQVLDRLKNRMKKQH